MSFYREMYDSIFKVTGKPKRILDMSSGLNPLSHIWMEVEELRYLASELSKKDVQFIQDYFNMIRKYSKVNGKAFDLDLLKLKDKEFGEKILKEHPELEKTEIKIISDFI